MLLINIPHKTCDLFYPFKILDAFLPSNAYLKLKANVKIFLLCSDMVSDNNNNKKKYIFPDYTKNQMYSEKLNNIV